ncbi:conserved hypothetical protein (plasmid) [Escherichia coli APEC O1]|uniref:Uncharacterized protein n=1 Tax=Escherichia coli O1:K1 / APEC TaxID=405955 RepID=A0A0H2XJX0_ECOK1|nr:conserved hypothetical protein [Escherichia coli APEC O1]
MSTILRMSSICEGLFNTTVKSSPSLSACSQFPYWLPSYSCTIRDIEDFVCFMALHLLLGSLVTGYQKLVSCASGWDTNWYLTPPGTPTASAIESQSRDKSFSVIGYSISTEYKAPAFSASSMFLYWALNIAMV